MRLLAVLLLTAALCVTAEPGSVPLTPALLQWKQEIERRGQCTVVVARVYTDAATNTLRLPADTPHRDIVKRFLEDESIVRVLVVAHAMNVNYTGAEGRFRIALLNMALAHQWTGQEEAVLAHEFSHMWIMAQAYPYSPLGSRRDVCEQSAANDVVQHILMRRDLAARHIVYNPYWISSLTISLAQLEKPPVTGATPTRCQQMAALATWIDVALGLTPATWPGTSRFLALLPERHPELQPIATDLIAYLRNRDVADKATYAAALRYALRLVEQVPPAEGVFRR